MPISEKIIKEIQSIDASEREKSLMLQILRIEDKGVYQYTIPYEKLINAFLSSRSTEDCKE